MIIQTPARIEKLPLHKGARVPWFVSWIKGKPDFRIADQSKLHKALKLKLCWVCGEPLGSVKSFVVGPMCAINRVSSEPPCHTGCAVYSATACPFLTTPAKERRRGAWPTAEDLPEGNTLGLPGGEMIERNPGVALVWSCRTYTVSRRGGLLWFMGDPSDGVQWFCEGRPATRVEVEASIDSGFPILEAIAKKDGRVAEQYLWRQLDVALNLLPSA